jgi:alkanesulfonate monooxygenase SsuD/methylene tetrahydromethanopterin reductase-like flavin-dependent oxidoreductase (luciferase family)
MDLYWETADRLGVDANPYRGGFAQVVVVADTDAAAERDYWEHAQFFYQNCLHVYEGFADAPGYRSIRTLEANLSSVLGAAPPSGAQAKALTWQDLVDSGAVVAGSPTTVRDRLVDVIKTLRVGHLMVLMQFGNMPRNKALRSTELFAKEVMPSLRGMWDEWTDHWYPAAAGQGAR